MPGIEHGRTHHAFALRDQESLDELLRHPNVRQLAYVIDHSSDPIFQGFVRTHRRVRTSTLRRLIPRIDFAPAPTDVRGWKDRVISLRMRFPTPVILKRK